MRPKHRPDTMAAPGEAHFGKAGDISATDTIPLSSLETTSNSSPASGQNSAPQSSAQGGVGKAGRQIFTPGLYIVATPIGNARDITLRALDLLQCANIVACEDTRVTRKLLLIHNIDRPTLAYHDHNAHRVRPGLMERLNRGEIVALVSDAGTPLISDPGYKLVTEARAKGFAVTALPGASAPMAALASAGLPTDRFLFAGFLPNKSTARRRALEALSDLSATLVFFEGSPRLAASLADMAAVLGPRDGAVMRELTKKFEEARHGDLNALAAHYQTAGPPKGEIVVLVAPATGQEIVLDQGDIDALLMAALAGGRVKDAAAAVAQQTGLPRRDMYNRALVLRGDKPGG